MNEGEKLLRELLAAAFYVTDDGQLCWDYNDDVSLAGILGAKFEQELRPYLNDKERAQLAALDTRNKVG